MDGVDGPTDRDEVRRVDELDLPTLLLLRTFGRAYDQIAAELQISREAVTAGVSADRDTGRRGGIPVYTFYDRRVTAGPEQGTVGPEEEDMLSGVIDLRLRQARDVMRPWEDVDVVRVDRPVTAVLDEMLSASHTRFPAVDGDGVVDARTPEWNYTAIVPAPDGGGLTVLGMPAAEPGSTLASDIRNVRASLPARSSGWDCSWFPACESTAFRSWSCRHCCPWRKCCSCGGRGAATP